MATYKNSSRLGAPLKLGEYWNGGIYFMEVREDKFVHFTYRDRAEQILSSKRLIPNYYNDRPSAVGAYAVSMVWGRSVKRTQYSGSDFKEQARLGNVVAVVFVTNDEPDYGYPEEVKWAKPVNIRTGYIETDLEKVHRSLKGISGEEDFMVWYDLEKAILHAEES